MPARQRQEGGGNKAGQGTAGNMLLSTSQQPEFQLWWQNERLY